ncbi:unnamed protein product, partial [marine sediment metagenome]
KYFILENVRVSKKWIGMFNGTVGVNGLLINSNLLSAQNRPRMYWTNIPGTTLPVDKGITLDSILSDEPISEPLSPYMTSTFNGIPRLDKGIFTLKGSRKACCLTRGISHANKIIVDRDNSTRRKLNRGELERL